jgi:hypothetical protein
MHFLTECSECLGETAISHISYVKLIKFDHFWDEFYEDEESIFCKDVVSGTLDNHSQH